MVKRIISDPPGFAFSQFSLLTGQSDKENKIQNVSLDAELTENLILKIPVLSAAMRSVTGYDMALELGKAGGLGVLPARLPIEQQVSIIEKIKNYEMSFVSEPIKSRETDTIEHVLGLIKRHGHSKIPVVDKNNHFLGMFIQEYFWDLNVTPGDKVTSAMIPFDNGKKKIPYCDKLDLSVDEAKNLLEKYKQDYLVVLDDRGRVEKLAFRKDVEKIKVASAITTHKGWQERVKANINAGVDLIVIDTSDAYTDFVADVVKDYKEMGNQAPICAGNIITYEGAMFLMESGADIVKGGMAAGSICTTQKEKAVGRAPFTVSYEMERAQKDFYKKNKKYIPTIIDGGITNAADMIIALTMTDAIMMGNYFNRFYEAAGEKLDDGGQPTYLEEKISEVVTFGEGSDFAQNLDRYGHESLKTFFAEGVKSTVPYAGRLKPNLKSDLMKIKAALVNVGVKNLEEFRKNAVIELMSEYTKHIVGETHDIK